MIQFVRAIFLFCFFLLFGTRNAQANILDELPAPIESSGAGLALGGGAVLTLGILAFGQHWEQRLTRDTAARDPLGRGWDKFGDDCGKLLLPNIAYAGGMFADYLLTDNAQSGQRSLLMVKSTLYSGAITDTLKLIVDERRPNGGKYSFPSGHTTTAFAFASIVGAEHPWYFGAAAYALGAFVAATRLDMNMHYLHDLIAGAAIGASYGLGLYAQAQEKAGHNALHIQLLPNEDMHGAYLTIDGSFRWPGEMLAIDR